MAKSELSGSPLIPFVLVAGILSGSLWRGSPADTSKAGGSGNSANSDKADVAAVVPSVSDLRPVLDSLDAALGDRGGADGSPITDASSVTLSPKGPARDRQLLDAMAAVRRGLNQYSSASAPTTCGSAPALQHDAKLLAASILIDDGGESKTRAAEAKALLEEYQDWGLLADLASGVKRSQLRAGPEYSVDFIVATIPDYVDSNSGWMADAGLAATQSAMAEEGYLFDRARLVDWSRAAAGPVVVLSGSRLHERQPGAIIFRKVDARGRHISLQVVLTVLETPTAGVHQVALRNSLWFLRAWNACSNAAKAPLKVLGPSFSGSTVSLGTVLREPPFKAAFGPRIVITGSATADKNPSLMKAFSDDAIFKSTVQPTSVLKKVMAEYLKSINSKWSDGEGVALLSESNTAFGRDASPDRENNATELPPPDPLQRAKIFSFPLHIAQLRSDAPSLAQPGGPLLSAPTIPLNLSEATPPSDVIPALRPQLTSAVVALTVDSILDAVRHEKLSAVGIIATDDRDVLFLAREVKRASPDVQLFLLGTHGLYLHGDYVPYLRGALVASSYALTLANQPEIPGVPAAPGMPNERHRQPFPSMSAEGVFYAARTLVSLSGAKETDLSSLEYCSTLVKEPCVPVAPVSINVIGEDGYWTLPPGGAAAAGTGDAIRNSASDAMSPPSDLYVARLPPLPLQFSIGAALVLVFVSAHLVLMVLIKRGSADRKANGSFFELPLVRVLAPPHTFDYAARMHRFALGICFTLLSLAAGWAMAIVLPFVLREYPSALFLVPVGVVVTVAGVFAIGVTCYGSRQKLADALPPSPKGGARRRWTLAEGTGWLLFGGMAVTMGLFAVLVYWTVRDATSGAPGRLTLSRMVGGGIVSPAAMTLCLASAFYAAVFTGVRRFSLVGHGYARLGGGSATFGLFTAEGAPSVGRPKRGSLAGMLDIPVRHTPAIYPAALVVILVMAALSTRRVVTIDGNIFSWFAMAGTWTTLGLGLMQVGQGLALWQTARSHLKRLAHTPIEKRLQEIAAQVPWEISLTPPRLTELVPVARMADAVMRDFRSIAFGVAGANVLRDLGEIRTLRPEEEQRLGVRPLDFAGLQPLFASPSHVSALQEEMADRQHAAIIQSESWFKLWKLSDTLVTLLQRTIWLRCATVAPANKPQLMEIVGIPNGLRGLLTPADLGTPTPPPPIDPLRPERHQGASSSEWFARCEQLVALQIAFVLRDIVARTITYLFAAMLCLTALAAAHLLYVFSGRTSLLTVDMLAIAGAAVSAVWILVDMERDHALSRLRTTTPGRVDINWEFIKRIAVYGVLPLLAVIAALFPEVGGTLFGWLEPLRKLSAL